MWDCLQEAHYCQVSLHDHSDPGKGVLGWGYVAEGKNVHCQDYQEVKWVRSGRCPVW